MKGYVLPEELRAKLSLPIGELISGRDVDVAQIIRERTQAKRSAKVILVGDSVSRRASEAGVQPDVIIIDNLEKRKRAASYPYPRRRVIRVRNGPGSIEDNARSAVEQAVRGEAELVEVEGEEDLLAIIAVLAAPPGSLVLYGQPNEGVVLVQVTEESKNYARSILTRMRRVDPS